LNDLKYEVNKNKINNKIAFEDMILASSAVDQN
jgi:hypothetical protein